MSKSPDELAAYLKNSLDGKLAASNIALGELTIEVSRDEIVSVLKHLRDDQRCLFEILIDICGVDWPSRDVLGELVEHEGRVQGLGRAG